METVPDAGPPRYREPDEDVNPRRPEELYRQQAYTPGLGDPTKV